MFLQAVTPTCPTSTLSVAALDACVPAVYHEVFAWYSRGITLEVIFERSFEIQESVYSMLAKTLFPGVAVVTGAGGTGNISMPTWEEDY